MRCKIKPSKWATLEPIITGAKKRHWLLARQCRLGLMRARWILVGPGGGGNELLQEVFTKFNIYGIPMEIRVPRWEAGLKEIINVDDLKGLKFKNRGVCRQDHQQAWRGSHTDRTR